MRAVDTNVLVRLITRDDPKQVAAAEGLPLGTFDRDLSKLAGVERL